MPLKKGQSGNPNGRPKGAKNKITKDVKAFISKLLDDNAETIERDFLQLEPKDRLLLTEKFFQYLIPKQQNQTQNITFDKMSETDINTLATNILKEL